MDLCSRTLLASLKAPRAAATTQLQLELMDARTDVVGLQDITRIWASFHFLPRDLYAERPKCSRRYLNKYRLICGPNGDLLVDTVKLAKGKGPQATGLAMHVLADTWAHTNFAGTPSLVINNTNSCFYELIPDGDGFSERPVAFRHKAAAPDDLECGAYTSSIFQFNENSIMNLGHGRAGHMPDYSFIRYRFLPAWGDYREIVKDNPADYERAFRQMVYAMRYLRGAEDDFEKETYDEERVAPYIEEIREILNKRQLDACKDWKAFGEKLSGCEIADFDLTRYQQEYLDARPEEKNDTFIGKFILAALAQKSMVTNKIFRSGNLCAGFSVDFGEKGFRGMRDYRMLVKKEQEEMRK